MTYQLAASGFGPAPFACSFAWSRSACKIAACTTRYRTQNPTAINTMVTIKATTSTMNPLTQTIAGRR